MQVNLLNMKSINSFLKQQVDENRAPSIQYAFFDSASIIHEFQYGLSDIKANRPVDRSTTYNLFSITKTCTALAVLQLLQSGKIRLNDPVSKYLPAFPYATQITIEQLLNHSSGIPNPLPLRWTHLLNEHKAFERDVFFTEVIKLHSKLKFTPGSKFSYSNLGYVILGQLIENISGMHYEAYIAENIFSKAGIDNNELGFTIDPGKHAKGYQKKWSVINLLLGLLINKKKYMGPSEGKWKPFNHFYVNGCAYGGMTGNATGLTKYTQSLLQEENKLLNQEYKKLLFTENSIADKPTGMSFSWFTGQLKNNVYYTHAGGGGGYYVELRIYPELGVGSVLMFNRSGMKDERLLNQVDSYFLTEKKK